MVIYEVLTGQAPFASWKDYIVMWKVTGGEHPERPEGVKGTWFMDNLWKMLGMCWEMQAQSRPSICQATLTQATKRARVFQTLASPTCHFR